MNSRERWLLDRIKNYHMIRDDVERLKARLQSASYKVTATYGLTAGAPSGGNSSKVESLGERRIELERELSKKQAIIASINDALENSGMTKQERDLIVCTIRGYTLSGYARQKRIYKSTVYKMRDKALKKMANCIEKHETSRKTG